MKRFMLFVVLIMGGIGGEILAQERQAEILVDLPAKSNLVTTDIRLGGKLYLPFGERLVVESDLGFKQAVTTFLAPSDQVDVAGKARVYLTTGGNVRPFFMAGIAHTMPLENPDFTNGLMGIGFNYKNRIIPIAEFKTDAMQNGVTVLGKDFSGRVEIFIPSGNFRFALTPYVTRGEQFGAYRTVYGARIGFSLPF